MSRSAEWMEGFTTAICFLSDIFERRTKAFYRRKWLRQKDTQLVVAIIDAALRARERMAEIGPGQMNLIFNPDGSFDFVEKKTSGG